MQQGFLSWIQQVFEPIGSLNEWLQKAQFRDPIINRILHPRQG